MFGLFDSPRTKFERAHRRARLNSFALGPAAQQDPAHFRLHERVLYQKLNEALELASQMKLSAHGHTPSQYRDPKPAFVAEDAASNRSHLRRLGLAEAGSLAALYDAVGGWHQVMPGLDWLKLEQLEVRPASARLSSRQMSLVKAQMDIELGDVVLLNRSSDDQRLLVDTSWREGVLLLEEDHIYAFPTHLDWASFVLGYWFVQVKSLGLLQGPKQIFALNDREVLTFVGMEDYSDWDPISDQGAKHDALVNRRSFY